MRRILSIAAAILVLAQAMAAGVPMLHQPPAPKTPQANGGHDCCPKPVVEIRDCCPTMVACPHRQQSGAACGCTRSDETAVPSRKMIRTAPALTPVAIVHVDDVQQAWTFATSSSPPLDNSPPILVLRI